MLRNKKIWIWVAASLPFLAMIVDFHVFHYRSTGPSVYTVIEDGHVIQHEQQWFRIQYQHEFSSRLSQEDIFVSYQEWLRRIFEDMHGHNDVKPADHGITLMVDCDGIDCEYCSDLFLDEPPWFPTKIK